MEVRGAHGLLRAVRAMRRGQHEQAKQHVASLPPPCTDLLDRPLADVCAVLAARVRASGAEPRAQEACLRFYGLERLPEGIDAIAASLPRSHGDPGRPLRSRRVSELLAAAETALAATFAAEPRGPAAGSGRAPGRDAGLAPGFDRPPDPSVEEVFAEGAAVDRWRVLLTAWADIPDGDFESAASLLLFEHDHGLRTIEVPPHPETRRRRRRRARAIVEVAIQRRGLAHARRALPTVEPVTDGLLGPRLLAADAAVWDALDHVYRRPEAAVGAGEAAGPDRKALATAVDYAHRLAQSASPHAAAALGALRHAVLTAPEPLPVGLVTRPLVSTAILARLHDDPAGVPAAWEALRLCRRALKAAREPEDADRITANALRAHQELAELYDRLGHHGPALATLARAWQLLRERGDPDRDEEPDGWHQQLLFSQGMILGHAADAALARGRRRPAERWLAEAQVAEAQAATLVRRRPELPVDWGLSAEAILVGLVVREVEAHRAAGDLRAARRAHGRARQLIAANEAGWRAHGAPDLAMSRSARLRTVRANCRLALADGDLEAYKAERARLAAAGPAVLVEDAHDIADIEAAAARRGVQPLHLARAGRARPLARTP
ncbi:MAG TPA: hypothetical protein VIL36_12835 [Acidimicrobiales bacterium]